MTFEDHFVTENLVIANMSWVPHISRTKLHYTYWTSDFTSQHSLLYCIWKHCSWPF